MYTTTLFLLKKYWLHLVVVAAILLVCFGLYSAGHKNGANEVQVKWDAERQGHAVAVATLQGEIKKLQELNRTENTRIDNAIQQANKNHAIALAALQSDYAGRLRLSEGRVSSYRRLSEGGTTEREYLANHAAELDRSLEQGRSLVRELRETVGQRDKEITALSERIKNDQRLFQ
jgi:chromosome segregation ATPase